MLLAGLFYHSYMCYVVLLVIRYGVIGYCYLIHDDVVVVQAFLCCLADCFFGGVKIFELQNSMSQGLKQHLVIGHDQTYLPLGWL